MKEQAITLNREEFRAWLRSKSPEEPLGNIPGIWRSALSTWVLETTGCDYVFISNAYTPVTGENLLLKKDYTLSPEWVNGFVRREYDGDDEPILTATEALAILAEIPE